MRAASVVIPQSPTGTQFYNAAPWQTTSTSTLLLLLRGPRIYTLVQYFTVLHNSGHNTPPSNPPSCLGQVRCFWTGKH